MCLLSHPLYKERILHVLARLPQRRLRQLAVSEALGLYRAFLYSAGRYPQSPFPSSDYVELSVEFADLLVHVLWDSVLYEELPESENGVQVPQSALEEAMVVEHVLCEEMASMESVERVLFVAQLVYDTYSRAGLYGECVGVCVSCV